MPADNDDDGVNEMNELSPIDAHEVHRDGGVLIPTGRIGGPRETHRGAAAGLRAALRAPWLAMRQAYLRRTTYTQLAALPDRTLVDIGVERGDIVRIADDLAARAMAEERRLAA